jgi:hypothetical protein
VKSLVLSLKADGYENEVFLFEKPCESEVLLFEKPISDNEPPRWGSDTMELFKPFLLFTGNFF